MKSWGQTAFVLGFAAVFILVGLGVDYGGEPIVWVLGGAIPMAGGIYFAVAALRCGAHLKDGRVVYRGVGTRKMTCAPYGRVEIEPSMYLPFIYLQELVVRYPDGSVTRLPGASPSSFRRTATKAALGRQQKLQEWLGEPSLV